MVMKRIALLTMCALVAACTSTSHPSTRPVTRGRSPGVVSVAAPTTFVSSRYGPDGREVIVMSDVRTGAVIETLLTVPSSGTEVSGTAIAPDGEVWVTLNTGPECTSDVLGCGPKPDSCSSRVIAINTRTDIEHTVLTGGNNELISDVQPSPVGHRIAYLYGGCATSYFNNSIRIRDLDDGHVVNIGEGLPRCHSLFQPRWIANGTAVAVVYGKATTTSTTQVAQESCSEPAPSTLVVVSAQVSQPGVQGTAAPLDAGCEINAVAVTRDGYAGIEQCGANIYLSGPVRVVRYNHDLRPIVRQALGHCDDGASLAGNTTTDTLIASTYQFCNPPGTQPPATKVFLDRGNRPQQLVALAGGYTQDDQLSF